MSINELTAEAKKTTTCYDCQRKRECYTEAGLQKLKPDALPYEGKYECGALFVDFDGARTFMLEIGNALNQIPARYQKTVFKHMAKTYNCSTYLIMEELYE